MKLRTLTRAGKWWMVDRHKPAHPVVETVSRAFRELVATAEILNRAPHLYPEHLEEEDEPCSST